MREIVKPGLVLFLVTLVAAVLLGSVYGLTKDKIQQQRGEIEANSMKNLFPTATSFKNEIEPPKEGIIVSIATGYENDNILGYVIRVAPKGYSGDVETLVGINTEGVIEGIEIINQSETPGLGANCQNPEFMAQYKNKSGKITVIKSGVPSENEIVAITSATITSNAVTAGVNEALEFYDKNIK